MASMTSRNFRWFALALFAGVLVVGLQWSGNAAQDQKPAEKKTQHPSLSVTGCLQKGNEAGGHYIIGDDRKMWELTSRTVKLDDHVGHKVTVTGTAVHRSAAVEKKLANDEKAEAAGKVFGDMSVSKLEMVSETCSQ
jgi:hypothetical protein